MKKIMFAALAASLLAGCYKVKIYWTHHPDTARITLTTDWSERSANAAMPEQYSIRLVDPAAEWEVSETRFELPNLLEPGTYTLEVFNEAEHVRFDGSVVSLVQNIFDARSSDEKANGEEEGPLTIYNAPGYCFWGSETRTIEADRDYEVTVPMQQITREIEFDLTIEGIDLQASETYGHIIIHGICTSWDCAAGRPVGDGMTVQLASTMQAGSNRITQGTRILGVMEDEHIEVQVVIYNSDSGWISERLDVTEDFKDFNSGERSETFVLKKSIGISLNK